MIVKNQSIFELDIIEAVKRMVKSVGSIELRLLLLRLLFCSWPSFGIVRNTFNAYSEQGKSN